MDIEGMLVTVYVELAFVVIDFRFFWRILGICLRHRRTDPAHHFESNSVNDLARK